MKFSVFQLTRQGGRDKNEDRMGYCYTSHAGLCVLADGMGGHPEGEVAAQLAVETISKLFHRDAQPELADVRAFLQASVMAAHRQIVRYAADKRLEDTPRTTVVALVVQGDAAYWAHCGDSRLYLVREGQLLARTRDHSFLEQRKDSQTSASAGTNRNVLYTCLGSPSTPTVDVSGPTSLRLSDRLLLCSDGLWGNLEENPLVATLAQHTLADAATALADDALRAGGEGCDNVTLVGLEWETPDTFEPTHAVLVQAGDSDEDGYPLTVQTADLEAASGEALDDAAIERSIAEINEAIRRTAARRH
jgi:PPM family protein phosphatase